MDFTKMKEKYKTKKSYRSWLISYFTFIVLFLFVFGIITFLSKNVLEGEIFKANEATFNTINANLNSIKTDINKFAITIATDKYTNAFVQEKDIKDTDYYNVYTLKSTVDNYIKTYDYIEELCILNQNTEQVFVNGNLVPMKSIYKNYKLIKEDGTSQNHDEWKVFLQQRHSQEMYQTSVGDLVYIQSIPFNQNGVLNGTIMLRISKWKINQIINDAGTSDNTFMILNHKNQVVFQSKDNEIANKISTENVDLSPGFKEMEAGGDKMEVFISKPNLNISGVFAVSGKAFWQLLNMFYISALILAFVLLIIGIVLARVFAKKHYTPLESLLELISKNKTDANPKNNEYDYIESYITEMLTKVNESEHQKKPLQDAFLVRLLKGNIQSISSLEDAMGNVGLSFKFQTFAVIAFYSDDYHVLFTDDETIEDDQREELAQFILKNIMEELFNEKYFSILVSVEYMPVLVVNLSEDAQNNWKQAFGEKLEYAKTAIRDNFGITFQSGVSKVCFSPEELSDAYSEAVETLEHKLLFANESIMFFEDIPEIEENTTHYGYYTEYEKNLVECIKTGNYEIADSVLHQIFESILQNTNLNVDIVKCFMFDVGNTIVKTLSEIHEQMDEEYIEKMLTVQGITSDNSISHMQKNLSLLLKDVCGYFNVNKNESKVSDKIKKYIAKNFSDPNMNVASIGDEFGLVPRYLSKIFKDETGTGLLDYINCFRIDESKKIIEETDCFFEVVAEKVGFTNVNSFIRVFKKYVGMTPGKYREIK